MDVTALCRCLRASCAGRAVDRYAGCCAIPFVSLGVAHTNVTVLSFALIHTNIRDRHIGFLRVVMYSHCMFHQYPIDGQLAMDGRPLGATTTIHHH